MKKILIVSHCILNTASKVAMDEQDLADEYRMKEQLLDLVLREQIQLIQLPCPEFRLYGSRRWGHVREQFAHPHYRQECRKMLEPVFMQLEEYLAYPQEFRILGVVSVEGSPSCGYELTCSGEWGGELSKDVREIQRMQEALQMIPGPGVFMEIMEQELERRSLNIPILSMEKAIEILSENDLSQRREGERTL